MYNAFIITVINIAFWTALHILGAAFITSFVPKKIYEPSNLLFKERAFEKNLYNVIKVSKWKGKLPIYQKKGALDRKHIPENLSIDHLEQFVIDTCKAELVHLLIGILGFSSVVFVICKVEPFFTFIVIAIVMNFAQIPFILVQRYNRPRLLKLIYRTKSSIK